MVVGGKETENDTDGSGFYSKPREREEMERTSDLQKITFCTYYVSTFVVSRRCKKKTTTCCVLS